MTNFNTEDISFEQSDEWDPDSVIPPTPFRLEHLPSEEANKPDGRGSETAAGRGYDNERLIRIIFDGTTDGVSWYDVETGYEPTRLIECKACIDSYPSGKSGTFKIWKPHHQNLLKSVVDSRDASGEYCFLVYTVVDDQAYEVGKFTVHPLVINELIDDWHYEDHETMGWKQCRELTWTRLMSALDLTVEDLRQEEIVFTSVPSWV